MITRDGPSVRHRPGAVGACADGVHAGFPHHPGSAGGVVGVHDAGREPPRHQEERCRRVVARPTVVQVHGGDVRGRRGHRHGAHVRVRVAVAELHGQVRRRVRDPVRDRRTVLLRRGDLHRHLHLRLETPEAVAPLLDRRPDRDRRHRGRGVGGRGELVDERAGRVRSELGRQGRQRRSDRGDLQQRDALRDRAHARRRLPRRRVPHRFGVRGRVPARPSRPLSPTRVHHPVHRRRHRRPDPDVRG